MTFNVGDRVKCIAPFDGLDQLVGRTGTVMKTTTPPISVGVSFDDWLGGHDCGGTVENNSGRFGSGDCLELIERGGEKNMSDAYTLSDLQKESFDADTQVLVQEGVLTPDLKTIDMVFLTTFLVRKHKSDMAKELRSRRAERERQEKKA